MSYEDEDNYTVEDLHKDMEALIDLGLIEVTGITDDGQWLYGATEESKRLFEAGKTMDPEDFDSMMHELLSSIDDDDNLSE